MHILIATQNYFQPNNGQAVFVARLARGLVADGHEVMVTTPSPNRRAYTGKDNGVQIKAVSSVSLAPWYADVFVTPYPGAEVAHLLDAFQPDVVHIQDHFPLCRSVVKAAARRGLPLTGTNHFLPENIVPFVPYLSRYAWSRKRMERLMWDMALKTFDRLDLAAAPTETAAEILRQQGLRVPVEAISCGVDLDAFTPDGTVDRAEIRRRYGLGLHRTVFLFLGRVDREKRLDVLIEALCHVKRGDIQLAVAGRGRDMEALQHLAYRREVDRQVVFTGYVPPEDVRALLNSADFFAMPSEAELQSIATLEAMAVGLPVLAANARALPELVEDGVTGYLFQAGSARDAARRMDQLASEKEGREAMSVACRRKAQTHGVQNSVRRYEELYGQAIAVHQTCMAIA